MYFSPESFRPPEVQTAAYAYNAVGQPVRKDVHRTDTSVLQRVNYAYEIMGALARINDPFLKDPDRKLP